MQRSLAEYHSFFKNWPELEYDDETKQFIVPELTDDQYYGARSDSDPSVRYLLDHPHLFDPPSMALDANPHFVNMAKLKARLEEEKKEKSKKGKGKAVDKGKGKAEATPEIAGRKSLSPEKQAMRNKGWYVESSSEDESESEYESSKKAGEKRGRTGSPGPSDPNKRNRIH